MRTLSNIIKGYGASKPTGNIQAREFLMENSSNRNIWFSKRRYAY